MPSPSITSRSAPIWLVAAVMVILGLALWTGIYFAVVRPAFGEPHVIDLSSFFVGAPLCSAALTAAFVGSGPRPDAARRAMAGASALASAGVLIGLGTLAMLAVAALYTWG